MILDQLRDERADVIDPIWQNPATPNAFRLFYNAERPKIRGPILWRENYPFMHSTAHCMAFSHDPRIVIFLKRIPPQPGDAEKIAHELGHAALFRAGFTSVVATTKMTLDSLASGLNSMLQDPLIARRLRPYGFGDPAPVLATLDGFKDQQPRDPFNLFVLAAWFTLLSFEYREMTDQALPADREQAFERRYPNAYAAAARIRRIVADAGGYDTPDQHRAIYRRVIREFKLQEVITCP